MRMTTIMVLLGVLGVGLSGAAPSPDESGVAEPREESVSQGRLLYGIYCTNCHGPEGRGNGPAAKDLNPRPADLSRLSRDNGGEFPTARVMLIIDGRKPLPGHDRGQMPIWGLTFQEQNADSNQERTVRRKIEHLVAFLETLQPAPDAD